MGETQAQTTQTGDAATQLGVDIVEIDRMRAILARSPAFAQRAFSEDERAYCNKTATPEIHYAMRFAAKEAVLKALGTGFAQGIAPRDVEVVLDVKGKPTVRLHGVAAKAAKTQQIIELPLSLSHTHREAVACAMALTRESKATPEQAGDSASELARRFKEARLLLDEL